MQGEDMSFTDGAWLDALSIEEAMIYCQACFLLFLEQKKTPRC